MQIVASRAQDAADVNNNASLFDGEIICKNAFKILNIIVTFCARLNNIVTFRAKYYDDANNIVSLFDGEIICANAFKISNNIIAFCAIRKSKMITKEQNEQNHYR